MVFRRARRDAPEEAFTSEIAEALRRAPGVLAVERVEPLQLRVTLPGRGPATAFLDNLFRETNGDGDEARARRIARFVRMMTAPPAVPPDWAAARDKLMPALRPVGRRATTQGDDRAACRAFAPFVDRFLAVDHPESMMIVTEAHLAAWGVEFEHAEHKAVTNLTAAGLPWAPGLLPGCIGVTGPNGYVSSWLLVPVAFEDAVRRLNGPVVAVAPSRDTCVFAPADDHATLAGALAWANEAYRSAPRRLSPVPYAWESGTLVPWRPPEGHPVRGHVDDAERVLAYYEYEGQKEVLQQLFDRSGEDVYVATMFLVEPQDGPVVSVAPWAKGVDNGLLPYADEILFGETGTEVLLRVPWDDACAIAADFIEPVTGMYPPRIRVTGWPEGRLDALRARARPR